MRIGLIVDSFVSVSRRHPGLSLWSCLTIFCSFSVLLAAFFSVFKVHSNFAPMLPLWILWISLFPEKFSSIFSQFWQFSFPISCFLPTSLWSRVFKGTFTFSRLQMLVRTFHSGRDVILTILVFLCFVIDFRGDLYWAEMFDSLFLLVCFLLSPWNTGLLYHFPFNTPGFAGMRNKSSM